MTSEERRRLRAALIALGFQRTSYTQDDGYGRYVERWTRGENKVEITWDERSNERVAHAVAFTTGYSRKELDELGGV